MKHALWQFAVLAQHDEGHRSQSLLAWYFNNMGLMWGVGIPFVSAAICLLGCVLLVTAKGRWVFALVALAAFLPLLVGVLATVQGMVSAFQVISASSVNPKPEELSLAVNTSLVTTYVGAALCLPPLLLAGVGFVLKGSRRA